VLDKTKLLRRSLSSHDLVSQTGKQKSTISKYQTGTTARLANTKQAQQHY